MKTIRKYSLLEIAIALVALLPLASAAQVTNTVTVDVRDWQDGRDQLVLSGNTVQWQHFDHNIPGIEAENEHPTWLTTTYNGLPILNSYPWYPNWTNAPVSGTFSSSFTNLLPSLPGQTLLNFQMQTISARDTMTLIEAPSPTNAYTTIVEFNDDTSLGADYYEVLLTYSFIGASNPPPSLAIASYAGLLITAPIGSTNEIEYSTDLSPSNWLPLADIVITNSPFFYCDQGSKGESSRFYRAITLP